MSDADNPDTEKIPTGEGPAPASPPGCPVGAALEDAGLLQFVTGLRELLMSMGRHRVLRDPFTMTAEEIELTGPQMHCLFLLGHETALTMGELARRLGITEKTVTGIVDRLEAAHHLQRERDTHDRRVVRVHLTAQGLEYFARIDQVMTRRMARLASLIDPQDRDQLFGILKKLHDRIAAKSAAAGMETK